MAERKPLSLNERNNRLLQGLSQNRSGKPPPSRPEVKARKVKLEGRRRLCKLSTETQEEKSEECWLDSPPKEPEREDGEEQIRDILSELTARLECLSVEKTKATVRDHVCKQEREHEGEEFGSANSSLSPPSILCISESEEGSGREGDKGKKAEAPVCANSVWEPVYYGGEEEECAVSCVVGKPPGRVDVDVDEEGERVGPGSDQKSWTSGDGDVGVVDVLDDGYEESSGKAADGDSITLRGTGSTKSSTYTLPAKIARKLYPHQCDGLKWLWSLHCGGTGGILGDDMGLGKTMQISSFLAGLFHSRLIKRALIVTPKTLLSHWAKELSVVGLADKTKDYFGTCSKAREYELRHVLKEGGVLLTTYDIVRNNFKSIRGDVFFRGYREEEDDDDIIWDYVLLDEGHFIKNPSTQRAKALFEIPSSHRIIISGTPIQNNLKELWALFHFCCPEVLGDKQMFKEVYEHKILRGNERNASDREKHVGSAAAKNLRDRIRPFFLRRLKSKIFVESDTTKGAGLSKKNEIIVWLRLSQCQRQLYEAFLKSELVNFSKETGSPLAALTILKKICDHPLLLTKRAAEDVLEGMDAMLNRDELNMAEEMVLNLANMTKPEDTKLVDKSVSCKTSFLVSLLDNLIMEGHSVLIFSQTRKMLNLIQDAVIAEGYEYLRIDGTTKASDREKIVNDFQGGKTPIFLLTSQVGGLGLTLTKADRVIVVDPAWNPSTDNQSVDRAYRIGQKKDVLVYRLMTCGSIEEKIYKKQVFKGGLFRIATEHKEQTRYFSQKDLQELFSLPKEGFDISLTQRQLNEEHDCHNTMDEFLLKHVGFLERLGIAGVSHHSLLFSKTANLEFVPDEDVQRKKANVIVRSSASVSSLGHNISGAEYAFNPKDVKSSSTVPSLVPKNEKKLKQEEIEEKIKRLSRTLANEAVISNLPDNGEKIRAQIMDLNLRLSDLRTSSFIEPKEPEFINLDDVADEIGRVLSA